MARALRNRAIDALLLTSAFLAAGLIAPAPAFAYVDPSVMTYTIQAVAGVAVALSAVLGVAFRRTRKAMFCLLKIDENTGKEVEPAAMSVSESPAERAKGLDAADTRARAAKETLAHGRPVRPLSWVQRFVRALVVCLFLVISAFVSPSLEVVAGALPSLNFNFEIALRLVAIVGALAIFALAVLLSLLRGRAFDIACALAMAFGLCCYFQALFLNGPLPAADGTPLDLINFKTITVISAAVWLAVFAACLILTMRKATVARGLCLALSTALVIVQGVGLASLLTSPVMANANETTFNGLMTTEGLYEFGDQDDVVVFVLDTYDTKYLKKLVAKHPDMLDEFTGFTWFQNATSAMIPTRYGIPFLLTGDMPQPGEDYDHYLTTRYTESPLIPAFKKAGYNVGIYTDSLLTNHLTPYADNLYETDALKVNLAGLLRSLAKISLYRDMPWLLKPPFWFYTDQINNSSLDASMNSYTIDDPALYQGLKAKGLSLRPGEKSFRFIHALGAHKPLSMDEEGNRGTADTLKWSQQLMGSVNLVRDYLREMKRLGIYDSATIVMTADHGEFYWNEGPLRGPSSAMLLVKPAETPEEAAAPLKMSQAPTGAQDYAATLLDAIGADRSAFGSTVWEVAEGSERSRPYWSTAHENHIDHCWIQYDINGGDVLDFDNWETTGEVIPIERHD